MESRSAMTTQQRNRSMPDAYSQRVVVSVGEMDIQPVLRNKSLSTEMAVPLGTLFHRLVRLVSSIDIQR